MDAALLRWFGLSDMLVFVSLVYCTDVLLLRSG
jgi:hypothetical protein